MKYTPVVLSLLTMGLVKAAGKDNLKVVKSDGEYLEWKKAAEKAKTVGEAKKTEFDELLEKIPKDSQDTPKLEVTKITEALKKVTDKVAEITALEAKEFKEATDEKKKEALGAKVGKMGVEFADHIIELDGINKKAHSVAYKELVKVHGHVKMLEFLKGKIESLEKDGFMAASLLSALALSALAVGASFN